MAIVDMKRVELLGVERDKRALLKAIQKLGCFQITPADTEHAAFSKPRPTEELARLDETITRVGWAIGRLNKYDKVKKLPLADKPSVTEAEAQATLDAQPELMRTVEALEALEREAGELRGQTARNQATEEQLAPWRGLTLPVSDVHSTRNTVAMLGTVSKSALDALNEQGALPPLCCVETISTQRDQAYIYAVAHQSCADEASRLLKEAGYAPVTLSLTGTVADKLDEMRAENEHISARQAVILTETAAHVDVIGRLRTLFDVLSSEKQRLLAAQNFGESERTFFLEGWVPAPMIEQVTERLTAVSPSVCLDFRTPDEDDEPPVLLHNSSFVSPYENIVTGFALPKPGGFDPTAVMMPFFVNFMGMMVSDAGYGLMMAILCPLLIKLLKPAKNTRRMMWMLCAGGVATVFWGAMYNTWFGFAPLPSLFDPMNNALPVMGLCIALGAVHLFTGLGVAAYINIRDGKPLDAVCDQLSWFLLIVGLALLLFAPSVGKVLAIIGAGIILVSAGRAKSKNPFKRLISGLGALYGITSWVSDLLSYMRLFGMGLATGVIGMVINQLVGMVVAGGPIGMVLGAVVFVFAHLFNAGINILGAYVHSCRLQYIEFFGKFYEDGGKPFVPLVENNRYVYVTEAAQRS